MAYQALGRRDRVQTMLERLRQFDPKMAARLEHDVARPGNS
jgi:hypothetical protein